MSLCQAFDGLSVANRALQQRHGGVIIRHARDPAQFRPSAQRRQRALTHWHITPDQCVVLFLGTPRRHKGLLETAQALASLQRSNLLFLIAGRFPASEQPLREALEAEQARGRLAIRLLDDQPFAQIPDLLRAANLLIQPGEIDDWNRYRVPSKLPEYLASCRPVLLPRVNLGCVLTHGDNALVLDGANAERITQAVLEWLPRTDALLKIGLRGGLFARRELSWSRAAQAVAALYQQVLSAEPRPAGP